MRPSSSRVRPLVALAVALGLVLAGCSSGSDDDAVDSGSGADRTTTTTRPAAEGSEPPDNADPAPTTTDDPAGDEAGDSGRDSYVDAVVTAMVDSAGTDDIPFTSDQMDCFAGTLIDILGYERLRDAGITPQQLMADDGAIDEKMDALVEDEEATARAIGDAYLDCGIDLKALTLAELASDGTLTEAQVDCVDQRLPDDFFADALLSGMLGGDGDAAGDQDASGPDDDHTDALSQALLACTFGG